MSKHGIIPLILLNSIKSVLSSYMYYMYIYMLFVLWNVINLRFKVFTQLTSSSTDPKLNLTVADSNKDDRFSKVEAKINKRS